MPASWHPSAERAADLELPSGIDYEIDEEEWGTKKKPYRYRWPDAVRDEVLARLLELNAQRALEEKLAGATKPKTKGGKRGKKGKPEIGTRDMFE
ncbi:hypothetical protein EKD04_017170 [Chloroflexales bacterium ZM16-3]|nr:hypothetical protein [Chloroflexales bacterium ZM16-3]